jgi:hypothetical protein
LTHLIGGSLFKNSWYELEDALGVTDEIVKENVKEELSGLLHVANELGYYDVDVSGDGGWLIRLHFWALDVDRENV